MLEARRPRKSRRQIAWQLEVELEMGMVPGAARIEKSLQTTEEGFTSMLCEFLLALPPLWASVVLLD